jgi:hypothetical protein
MFFSGLLGKRSNERDSRSLERNQHSVFDVFDYRFKLQIVRKSYFNLNNFWIEHEDHRNKINFVDIFTSYPVRSKMEKKNTILFMFGNEFHGIMGRKCQHSVSCK